MALPSHKQGGFSDNHVEKQRNGYSGSEFLDSRWSGVGAHMGDHELEEGEACDEPDIICDPDTDFTYLDEKIFRVLGDVQKFLKGGVSAGNLGSKFGRYGSFLPTQERTPSILHQDKPASVVASDAYCRTKKLSSEGLIERIQRIVPGSSVQASSLKAGSGSAVSMHENRGRESRPFNQKTSNVESSFAVGRVEENTGHPTNFKIKIKMGSGNTEKKKTSTIYSDFGLSNTSSSEEEDEFANEVHRTDSDLDPSPVRTPLDMIRIMTSHHIPDGMLLSPLPDLETEPFLQEETTCQGDLSENVRLPRHKKVRQLKEDGDSFEKVDIQREHAGERKGESAVSSQRALKRVKVDKDRGGSKDSRFKAPSKALGRASSKVSDLERQARDAVSVSGTGARLNDLNKDYKGFSLERAAPDYPIYEAVHIPKDFCSHFQPPKEVHSGGQLQARGYRGEKVASSSHDSIIKHFDASHQGRQDAGKEVLDVMDTNLHGKRPLDVSSEPLDGKKRGSVKGFLVPREGKANSSQDRRHSTSEGSGAGKVNFAIDTPARGVPESKKQPTESGQEAEVISRGFLRERGKDFFKEVRRKGKRRKPSSVADFVVDETPKDGPHHSSKIVAYKDDKGFRQVKLPNLHKTEGVEHKWKEGSKERVTVDYGNKRPPKTKDRQRGLATHDVSIKIPQPAGVPEGVVADEQPQQPQLGALPPPPAGNDVVMDNWVGCDKCQKWRLLPPGVGEANLPKKWRCKMLNWLEEGMNNCSIPEATTDERTRALYNTVADQPAPTLPPAHENASVMEQVPPPFSALTSLPPPPSVHVSQKPKAPEKIRGATNKKRKLSPIASRDNIVPTSKSKSFAKALQVTQDGRQAKVGGGGTITTQERTLTNVGGPDSSVGKTGEEKQRMKEREKGRHHHPFDGESGSSPGKKHSETPASMALQEATKLIHKADDLKGQEPAGTALYLQAALKFLQAASMLEFEGSEHGDNRRPAQIYGDTARLCEFCASTYERSKDLAAAALAYQCTGLARMRVVQAKSSLISRVCTEVQSAHQDYQVAPGESPSSSTPLDIYSAMERMPTQGAASPTSNPHTGGSFIVAAKSRTSFKQIFQFVAETTTAVDALSRAVSVFTAAESAAICSQEGMSALRTVLDFGFHDVDSFVRLVLIALEAMGH